MPKDRKLRLFTRLDGGGRAIAGSSVYRKHLPKTGSWIEEKSDVCCTGVELTSTPSDVSDTDFTLAVKCDATTVISQVIYGTTTTIAQLVVLLNTQAGFLGRFSVSGSNIILDMNKSVFDGLDCDGTLSFTVVV